MRTPIIVLALAVISSTQPAPAPSSQFRDADRRTKLAALYADIDRLFSDFARGAHAPGAAWGIVVDGELAHAGAFGVRDVAARAPVDADTVFRIASMTKSFTAMAILQLRDDGKLSLDDPAERYVPELKSLRYPTSDSPRITIRHLLTHSEGFPEDNPWGDQQLSESEAELSRMMRGGIPFSNAPGMAYEYSNYGFAILGRIVSAVATMPYDEYISRRILQPLGMTSTTLHPEEGGGEPPCYRLSMGGRAVEGGAVAAARIVRRDGRDADVDPRSQPLRRVVPRCVSAPRRRESGPLRRASLREMQQPWRPSALRVTRDAVSSAPVLTSASYGYGLGVTQTCQFRAVVAHSGGLPGYGSLMRWLPDYGVGIIAFGNVTYTGWGRVVGEAFDRMAATGGLQPREVRPSEALTRAQRDVSRLIVGWDDTLADSLAAENLFLDRSKDRRRREIEALVSKVGAMLAADGLRRCRERAPRAVDHELRARRAACLDYARADDAPRRPVPLGGAVTPGTGAASDLLVGIQVPRDGIEWQTLGRVELDKSLPIEGFRQFAGAAEVVFRQGVD